MSQIDKIRQVRNDNHERYPLAIETLWVLLKSQKLRQLVEAKKKELGLETGIMFILGGIHPDMKQWDAAFQYTLDMIVAHGELND